jgi:hypothetical protein
MDKIFTFLIENRYSFGELKKANLYEGSCNIIFEKGNKIYDVYITCNEKKEEEQ